jgi:hypothetical protein
MTATARRATLLSIVVVLSIGVASGYTWYALQRTTGHPQPAAAAQADADSSAAGVLRHPHIVFQNTKTGPTYGKVAAVALRAPGGRRTLTTTSCDRVYSVGVAGLCLTTDRGVVTKHRAHVLDAALRPGASLPTGGEPSRVRLAANGRLGATTTFSAGHSYLSSSFSTATTIYDVKSAKALHNVEEFAITRNGMPYQAVDVNLWGVTFKRDGDGFYATMASKGTIHLVEGSVRSRTLRTLKEGVECRRCRRTASGWRTRCVTTAASPAGEFMFSTSRPALTTPSRRPKRRRPGGMARRWGTSSTG